jgi:hypothetical protein
MIRLLPLVLAAGCAGDAAPELWIETARLLGGRGEHVQVRCRTSGLVEPIVYSWAPGPAVGVAMSGPRDGAALLVTVPASAQPAQAFIGCTAVDANNRKLQRQISLAPVTISAARAEGRVLTVEGSGFGASRAPEDAVWLIPHGGAARAADHGCKGAAWSDARIVACVPPGRFEVRVQSAGRLGRMTAPTEIK